MLASRLVSSASRAFKGNGIARYNTEFSKFHNNLISVHLPVRDFSTYEDENKQYPSLDYVKSSPLCVKTAKNETIIRLAAEKIPAGCIEQLKRHIMIVESIEYPEACEIFEKIKAENTNISSHLALPNKAGVIASVSGAFLSIPLCFHYPTVHWFNEYFVSADVPEPRDLETWLEVGAWAWNWMEPVMGQLSFLLLCLAFARSQFQTLGITPFSQQIKSERAMKVVKKFPMYDEKVLTDFSTSQPFDWALVKKLRSAILK